MAQKGIIRNSMAADVSAENMAAAFHALIGSSGILDRFNNLTCTKVTDNSVRIDSGVYSLRGFILHVEPGTTINLAIDSGTAGQKRNDLVVAELVKNGGGAGIDTLQFRILKGASTSGIPADPTLTQQDVNAAGNTCQEALYRIKLDSVTITAVEKIAPTISNVADMKTQLNETETIIDSGGNSIDGYYTKYSNGDIEFFGKIDLVGNFSTGSGAAFTKNLGITCLTPVVAVLTASMYDGISAFSSYRVSVNLNGANLDGFFGNVYCDYAAAIQSYIGVHYHARSKWK